MSTTRHPLRSIFSSSAWGIAFLLSAQADTWSRKNDVAYNGWDGPLIGNWATAFGVGDKGYVIGIDSTLWAYEPTADQWTARGKFPGNVTGHVAFGIGDRGYVCRLSAPITTWEYDPATDTWTTKSPFPGAARTAATGFGLNGKGYVGTGRSGTAASLADFWEFDPVGNTWTQKANYPIPRENALSFTAGGKGHIARGHTINSTYNTLYAYDPATDTWTQRANVPGNGRYLVAFGAAGKGYIGCGVLGASAVGTLYEYDPAINAWVYRGAFGDIDGRESGFAMAIGNKGYIGGGRYYGNHVKTYNDFWEYDPASSEFTQRQYLGGMRMMNCSAVNIGGKALFIAGSRPGEMVGKETWHYDPINDHWQKLPDIVLNREASSAFSIGGIGYKTCGSRYSVSPAYTWEGARYDPQAQSWTWMPALIGAARAHGVGCSVLGKGYVGLGTTGSDRNDWWQYDPTANSWTQMTNFPGNPRQSAVAFRVGNKLYVGTGMSTERHKDIWMYDPTNDTWTQKADFGGTARHGAVAFTIGDKGYIATGDDGTKRKDLWEYDAASDTWTQRADLPGAGRSNAFAVVLGATAYVGTGRTANGLAHDMWAYTPLDPSTPLRIRPRMLLEGPWDETSNLMNDDLRANGLLPLTEPYTRLLYEHTNSGGEQTTEEVLAVNGNDAIVDWVIIELRRVDSPNLVVASASALLQRDGDVVDVDGTSPVDLHALPGTYQIAMRHRNHLGAMTIAPVALGGSAATIDLTSPSLDTYGTEARRLHGGKAMLWCGDVNGDGRTMYSGIANDRDLVLTKIGGTSPTNILANVYAQEDVNLDGRVLYTGIGNDRDHILQSIGGGVPTNVRAAQLP